MSGLVSSWNIFTERLIFFMIRVLSLFLLFCSCMHVLCVSARAADWLTLVGTEPPGRDFKWWGIIQPQYIHDYGKSLNGLT
jgi:hypothetical protein